MSRPTNRYDRGLNKRAKARKERAKEHSAVVRLSTAFEPSTTQVPSWPDTSPVVTRTTPEPVIAWHQERFIEVSSPRGMKSSLLVGDRVELNYTEDLPIVSRIYPRLSTLKRQRGDEQRTSPGKVSIQSVAANITRAIVVASSCQPDFNESFVDRYIVLCHLQGLLVTLCVTKADLGRIPEELSRWYEDQLSLPVVHTSTVSGSGIEELRTMLIGETVAMVGESGVGKSSIINAIVTGSRLRVSAVSERDGAGRHTTTGSVLLPCGGGGFVIDTPGIRSLRFFGVTSRNLAKSFPDFSQFARECRFLNCLHFHEPNCAVRGASETGALPTSRYKSYLSILEELL